MPLLRGLMMLQEKWVLFILWELVQQDSLGFNDLTRRSPVNPTTLAARLDLLEHEGIVIRSVHSTIPPKTSYTLTPKGRALREVLQSIRRWAEAYPPTLPDPGADCRPEGLELEGLEVKN